MIMKVNLYNFHTNVLSTIILTLHSHEQLKNIQHLVKLAKYSLLTFQEVVVVWFRKVLEENLLG